MFSTVRAVSAVVVLSAAIGSATALAQTDARSLAAACAGCHAADGASRAPTPSLDGRSADAIARALRDYRDGRRSGTVMPQLAKGYRDDELDAIARWFGRRSTGATQ